MSWAYAICENADVFEKHDLQLLHLVTMLPDLN